jgi:hypothetical protein
LNSIKMEEELLKNSNIKKNKTWLEEWISKKTTEYHKPFQIIGSADSHHKKNTKARRGTLALKSKISLNKSKVS